MLCASRIPKSIDKVMENIERLLGIWIEDQAQHNVPVSLMVIQEKAKSFIS
jgi:predicted RNase H-like HicB family nuclease